MTNQSRFHQEVRTLSLTGSGETREEALNQILTAMRQRIMKETPGPILFMAPVGLEITRATSQSRTERFLGLLWPRTRTRVELEARMQVEVRWLQFE
jgi:uncharacterized protein (TIGR03578 family)